jgi:archaemetzincin
LEGSNKAKIIIIQPFDDFEPELLPGLKQQLSNLFRAEVIINKNKSLPQALADKFGGKFPADSLLRLLEKEQTGRVVEVIGLTHKEIFIPKLLGGSSIPAIHPVRGYGYIAEGICIVSDHSLTSLDPRQTEARLVKATLHEVGHNIGLAHCSSPGCIMLEQSGDIVVLDKIAGSFCKQCKTQAN